MRTATSTLHQKTYDLLRLPHEKHENKRKLIHLREAITLRAAIRFELSKTKAEISCQQNLISPMVYKNTHLY